MARILIVDDEAMICEEFRDLLVEEDHQVDTAVNGEEAIKKVQDNDYDLIFLDVLMPRMEGRQVLDRLKKIKPIPVVIMSGYLPANKEKEIIALGAYACLRKPLDLSKVKGLVQSVTKPQ